MLKKLIEFSRLKQAPLLCLEVNPPRGVELSPIFGRLDGNIEGIDFFNVTDSALARMRFAPLPFAAILKQRYSIEPLVNLSCRDRNLIAIQGDLLAGWASGVRSVVALTGDAVSVGDFPECKGVFEVNSVGLLRVVETLNNGMDLAGNALAGAPGFAAGVVVNPNARNARAELKKLAKKKAAGACFALSQPVFDEEASLEFFAEASKFEIPIFMGLLPLATVRTARAIGKVPGIRLSEELARSIEGLSDDHDLRDRSFELCTQLARNNRPHVCGFHVISGTTPKLALKLAQHLAGLIARW